MTGSAKSIEVLGIERECERLVLDFAEFSDGQNYEALVALFAPDGTMTRPSGGTLAGREAILQSYQAGPVGRLVRHICTNIRITVESPDRARGRTSALVYQANSDSPPTGHFGVKAERHLVGEFEDEFVRAAEGWRFAARRARFVMHL